MRIIVKKIIPIGSVSVNIGSIFLDVAIVRLSLMVTILLLVHIGLELKLYLVKITYI